MAWVGDNKMNMVEGAQMIETRSEETLRKTYMCNADLYQQVKMSSVLTIFILWWLVSIKTFIYHLEKPDHLPAL